MLGLSVLLIAATGGLTYAAAMLRVAWEAARRPKAPPRDAVIIVLGARLPWDGGPDAEFRERLDHGARLLRDNRLGELMILGGVTRPGAPSEADAGSHYLIGRHGVSADRIRCETRSRHTLENLAFYRDGLANRGRAVALVTSRFHMARACLLARGLGLTVHPAPSGRGARGVFRVLVRLPSEGLLVHWYVVGRVFARVTRNDRMTKRIS